MTLELINVTNKLIQALLLLLHLLFYGCVHVVEDENEEETYIFEIEPRLDIDDNGFYHLTIDRNNWQTIYRVSGHVNTGNGNPVDLMKKRKNGFEFLPIKESEFTKLSFTQIFDYFRDSIN